MDPNLGPGTYAWFKLKLEIEGVNDAARSPEDGSAEAGGFLASILPLVLIPFRHESQTA